MGEAGKEGKYGKYLASGGWMENGNERAWGVGNVAGEEEHGDIL